MYFFLISCKTYSRSGSFSLSAFPNDHYCNIFCYKLNYCKAPDFDAGDDEKFDGNRAILDDMADGRTYGRAGTVAYYVEK